MAAEERLCPDCGDTDVKRERPGPVPLSIQVKVLERQLLEDPYWSQHIGLAKAFYADFRSLTLAIRKRWLISQIFGRRPVQLDHDPALILRKYYPNIKKVAQRYSPHAHNPKYLIFRINEAHLQKTTGRAPGAERTVTSKGSDMWLKRKFQRLEKPRKRHKRKIQSRGFQKVNRRLTSRQF